MSEKFTMGNNRISSKSKEALSNLKGDYGNIVFLLLLYVLQGIPIGLSTAVPLLLQNRKISYSEQALFSFVTWPFSLKLLWAPIVDSVYWRRMGRRKSWLVPIQLGIGIFMLILSRSVTDLLADNPATGQKPNIQLLTFIFLMLNFLAATQDIAVDGWALTMLSRRNVGYASTCNTVGQTAGFFIGNVIFLALESSEFSNKYLRSAADQSPLGVVTFEEFLYHSGIIFLVVTILVAILRKEDSTKFVMNESNDDSDVTVRLTRRKKSDASVTTDTDEGEEQAPIDKEMSVKETYSILYKIMKLPSLKLFALILLTMKIGFSAPDAVSGLKLIEAGVHKENLALLAVPMVPLQIILPWMISRLTCGPRPLDVAITAYPYRLIFGIIFPLVVYWTPSVKLPDGSFPYYYYGVLIIVYALHQVTVYSIFVTMMAFHAAVSDPSIGGTYMTLLNTIANLGGNWPSTVSLWLVDKLTIQKCSEVCTSAASSLTPTTAQPEKLLCKETCTTLIDGYYLECAFCVILGFVWLSWGGAKLRKLQSLPAFAWSVTDGLNKVN